MYICIQNNAYIEKEGRVCTCIEKEDRVYNVLYMYIPYPPSQCIYIYMKYVHILRRKIGYAELCMDVCTCIEGLIIIEIC